MIAYPKKKDTPSRKMRKGARFTTFIKNKKEAKLRREQRVSVRQAQAAKEQA